MIIKMMLLSIPMIAIMMSCIDDDYDILSLIKKIIVMTALRKNKCINSCNNVFFFVSHTG